MKKIFMFLLILLTIFAARYFFNIYNTHKINGNQPPVTATSSDSDLLPIDDVTTLATGTKWLDAEISYPKNNTAVRDKIFADYYSWASDTQILSVTSDIKAKEMMIQDGMQYEYNASYVVATSTDYTSYIYDIYTYTGGAHGGVGNIVFTFDKNGNKKDLNISLESIKKVLPLIRADIKKQMMTNGQVKESDIDLKWLNDGTAATKENYSIYWYEGDNIVFKFGQYQVAPYVYGEFEVKIPLKSL